MSVLGGKFRINPGLVLKVFLYLFFWEHLRFNILLLTLKYYHLCFFEHSNVISTNRQTCLVPTCFLLNDIICIFLALQWHINKYTDLSCTNMVFAKVVNHPAICHLKKAECHMYMINGMIFKLMLSNSIRFGRSCNIV